MYERYDELWKSRRRARLRAAIEALEVRSLLSGATLRFGSDHLFRPADDISHAVPGSNLAYTNYQVYNRTAAVGVDQATNAPAPPSSARTPAQIRHSYGVDTTTFNGIVGDGTGQTIAIIDAYDDRSFVSDTSPNFSISDLARFDSYFGLPDPPSFKKFNQSGGTSYPSSGVRFGWTGEIALDVEWAHAMAPKAAIWLVEASNNSDSNLVAAVDWARSQSAVSVITMSYGGTESSGETSEDPHYTTPSGHTGGVTFLSSSGDDAGVLLYQSSSPNVVGVGGTTLNQSSSSGAWSSEVAWSGSAGGNGTGGGISAYESKPSYQQLVTTPSSTKRTSPDIAADADPSTGVAVLDTSASGIGSANPWFNGTYGGTSLSSPMWAGIMAIVNQGRSLLSTPLSTLNGVTQTLPRLYTLNPNDFHDITSGSSGSLNAGVGYDLTTGRGSPKVNQLAPDLAGGATITGTVFQDNNANGIVDSGEPVQAGVSVYLDLNNNGVLDSAFEPSTTTNAAGVYTFSDLVGGTTFAVREATPSSFVRSSPLQTTTAYNTVNTFNIVNFPLVFNGTSGDDAFSLSLDPTQTITRVGFGANQYAINKTLLSTLTFNGNGGNDTLTIDETNGSPVPSGGVTFNGGGQNSNGGTLILIGGAGADSASIGPNVTTFGGTINQNSVTNFSFNGDGGNDSLTVNSGTLTLPASQVLQSLTVASGATVTIPQGAGAVLDTKSLTLNGTIDLADNAMVVDYTGASPLASIVGEINSGRAVDSSGSPTWNGSGITSSVAAEDPLNMSVGAIDNAALGSGAYTAFFGQPIDQTSVLIRATVNGDANLDGTTDTSDFILLATNFNNAGQSWGGGDFNFDGTVNALDFNTLATTFGTSLPPPAAPASASLFSDQAISSDTADSILS